MAVRVVTQADIDNTIYSNWIAAEGLPNMVLGDVIMDAMIDISNGYLWSGDSSVVLSTARATPTFWIDAVAIALEGTLRQIVINNNDAEWDRDITIRPLRGQVRIEVAAGSQDIPISITRIRHALLDGECNSYSGLRNGITSIFLTGAFGFDVSGIDAPTNGFNGININNQYSTNSLYQIRGVELQHGFAGIRINQGSDNFFPIVEGVIIERNYRHDSGSGEGIYIGSTQLETDGYSEFNEVIIRNNIIVRCAREPIQVQHMTSNAKRSAIYNNISIGGGKWLLEFLQGQDNNAQFKPADGNVRVYNNIFDTAGFAMWFMQASTLSITLPQTDVFRFFNNLCINGKATGFYLHGEASEGVEWEIIDNYFIKFNNWFETVAGSSPYTTVVGNGGGTDKVSVIGNIKDSTRATWGKDLGSDEINNAVNNDTLLQPDYNQAGIDYTKYKGNWTDSKWNQNADFITWSLDDIVSLFTIGIGTRIYKCILAHTSIITSDPVIDTSQWTQMTWDASGIRVDEAGHTSGDTQSNLPPDDFTITADELWNQKDMGLGNSDAPSNFSKFKWYYADDAIGTNLIQLAYEKEGIFDINAIGHEWIARKTGKYIIGSITPVDSNGLIGTETFATGIII